ncbi:hypothetical protein BH11BAC5_BH11BAC5_04300 [soil metagenome]
MFYRIVKTVARIAIKFYCRDIKINQSDLLKSKGPLLLAVNHPNSFLDAIILCTLFDEPVYSLARGDAFNGKIISTLLNHLKMLPVYRITEGVENLEENYTTFSACTELFKRGGTVLIFCEGRCENEWHLRPLKKGTARLAIAAWEQNIPLKVLPIGINYNSFRRFGKNVHINMGELIGVDSIVSNYKDNGRLLNELTAAIQKQLQTLVYEIGVDDQPTKLNTFQIKIHTLKRALLVLPGMAGLMLHWPLYILLKQLIVKKTLPLGHFDSIMVGLLLVTYPCYLLLWALLLQRFLGSYWGLLPFFVMPFFAWCYVQIKKQVD